MYIGGVLGGEGRELVGARNRSEITPGTSTVYPEIHSEMAAKVIGILIISSVVEARFSTQEKNSCHATDVLCTRIQKSCISPNDSYGAEA